MKKSLLTFITITIVLIVFSGCASKSSTPKERNETFIAEVNPFAVENFHLYTTKTARKPTISDFTAYFVPQTNYVLLSTKIGVNFVRIDFSYNERKSLNQAKETYLQAYNSNAIPNEKPKKKNAYSTGKIQVSWGVAGLTHFVDTTYITNAYYLEPDKPYFRISIEPAEEEGNEHVYSPSFCIYISPQQWDQILAACNQEHLVELTDEILAQAEAF